MIKNYFMQVEHKWPIWRVAAAIIVVYFCIKAIEFGMDKLYLSTF